MITKNEFIDLYINKKMSLCEIARQQGVKLGSVQYWRKKYEIPLQPFTRGGRNQDVKGRLSYDINATNCWVFRGSLDRGGYGQISVQGKPTSAPRASYEAFIGPIPPGMCVCHTCDNPRCVNPDHLFLGTQKDNVQDCIKKGRFKGCENLQKGRKHIKWAPDDDGHMVPIGEGE